MFQKYLDKLQSFDRKTYYLITLGGGILLFIISGCVWWAKVYTNPQNVYWAMINNSLATPAITKYMEGPTQSGSLKQTTQINLGVDNVVHSSSRLTGISGDGSELSVTTETFTTKDTQYVRYTDFGLGSNKGKNADLSKVKNIWGKNDASKDSSGQPPQPLVESMLGTVPIGQLSAKEREELVGFIHDQNVYSVNYQPKTTKIEGKAAYVYTVKIKPKAYISMLREFAEKVGVGEIGLQPDDYADIPDITVDIAVYKSSRQLAQIVYQDGSKRKETYTAGVDLRFVPPTDTIPLTELQQRIQGLQI